MKTPHRRRSPSLNGANRARLGLVCAGGGVTGAIYEIGALAAIEERLENASLTDFDTYVGVSAGAYIATLVSNGVSPSVLYRSVTRSAGSRTDLDDLALFTLNIGEILKRLAAAPLTVLDAAWDFYRNRRETTLTDLVQSLGELLPSGVFRNEGVERWLSRWLDHPGRTDDFRKLTKKLRIVAVELDTGDTTAFGTPGLDDIPISKAVQASCAIPGLYRPVNIRGIDYIDGGVKKTAHISLAIKDHCGLILCVNPIVPIRQVPNRALLPLVNGQFASLSSRGLPTILDQVFRVTLHSRMRYGLSRYRHDHPDTDILVFEPRPEDLPRYMRNLMRTSGRVRIAEYAYVTTMQRLDEDYPRVSRLFARHGLKLKPPSGLGVEPPIRFPDEDPHATDTPSRLKTSLNVLERKLESLGTSG